MCGSYIFVLNIKIFPTVWDPQWLLLLLDKTFLIFFHLSFSLQPFGTILEETFLSERWQNKSCENLSYVIIVDYRLIKNFWFISSNASTTNSSSEDLTSSAVIGLSKGGGVVSKQLDYKDVGGWMHGRFILTDIYPHRPTNNVYFKEVRNKFLEEHLTQFRTLLVYMNCFLNIIDSLIGVCWCNLFLYNCYMLTLLSYYTLKYLKSLYMLFVKPRSRYIVRSNVPLISVTKTIPVNQIFRILLVSSMYSRAFAFIFKIRIETNLNSEVKYSSDFYSFIGYWWLRKISFHIEVIANNLMTNTSIMLKWNWIIQTVCDTVKKKIFFLLFSFVISIIQAPSIINDILRKLLLIHYLNFPSDVFYLFVWM
jgi:hypothetical protein